jgi:hypothetical protein
MLALLNGEKIASLNITHRQMPAGNALESSKNYRFVERIL